jgi:hypothetical protein
MIKQKELCVVWVRDEENRGDFTCFSGCAADVRIVSLFKIRNSKSENFGATIAKGYVENFVRPFLLQRLYDVVLEGTVH